MGKDFLRVKNGNLIANHQEKITLKGINLGGWLMMEGYILGGRNIAEHQFKSTFKRLNGKVGLKDFVRLFRKNFIRPIDFKIIRSLNFNCIRLPFNYRLLREKGGLAYLEEAVRHCKKNDLYCILDLHAAPGSQNTDWHSDSAGRARLWRDKNFQKQFIRTWEKLAFRFKDEATVAGFDLLNEAVYADESIILRLYKQLIKSIRAIDKKHIIFLEGNNYGQRIAFMGKPWDDNLAYSIHFYAPLEFTFGFVRNLKYPGRIYKRRFSKADLKYQLSRYDRIRKKFHVPILVGEFGQKSRCPYCHKELSWLKDVLGLFKQFDFHWTYWTYKAIAASVYPDGLYQYLENPAWVSRQEPVFGWEAYSYLWKKHKKEISRSWKTDNFKENKALAAIFRKK